MKCPNTIAGTGYNPTPDAQTALHQTYLQRTIILASHGINKLMVSNQYPTKLYTPAIPMNKIIIVDKNCIYQTNMTYAYND